MKRKIMATILALCMIFSCASMLTACGLGGGKGISKTEWNSGLNASNKNEIALAICDGQQCTEVKYDGTNLSVGVKYQYSEEIINETRYIKNGSDYDVYTYNGKGRWDKSVGTSRDFDTALANARDLYLRDYSAMFKIDDFTFNETTNKYEADQVVFSIESFIGTWEDVYDNVKISFENKKVSSISYYDKTDIENYLTFSYSGVEISAPVDNTPVGPIATETAWNSALDLTACSDVQIVQTQNDVAISTFKWDGTNLYNEASGVCILIVKENDTYYRYMKMNVSDAWGYKTAIGVDGYNAYITAYLLNSEIYHFEDFTYNPYTEKYEAPSVDQTGDGVTVTITNVEISFVNNMPSTISYVHNGNTVLMTYSYDDVTIEIPQDNE